MIAQMKIFSQVIHRRALLLLRPKPALNGLAKGDEIH